MTKQTKLPGRPVKNQISLGQYSPTLIRVFAVCLKKVRVLKYPNITLRKLRSDRLIRVFVRHPRHFIVFVMLQLKLELPEDLTLAPL